MLHFLLDYLVILQNLSLLFQREQRFLSTTELHVTNTMASIESLKQYEEGFITNTSLKGIYQDARLHGLSNTTRSSSDSEKENVS
jgi:hypothetical protein